MTDSIQPIDCTQAQAIIRSVVAGQVRAADRMALRIHVQDCEDCHGDYVASMETLAALGHEKRVNRAVKEKALRDFEWKRSIEQADKPTPKKLANGRLRTLLYPAFFAMIMLAMAGRLPFGEGPKVMAQGPGVWIRGHELAADAGKASIKHGEALHTGPGGHALVSVRDTLWRLRGKSAVRLEGVSKPTMRLAEGQLECRGAGRCVTEYGVVIGQEDSLVRMVMDETALQVIVEAGRVSFVSASGETWFEVGESWRVGSDGIPVRR